MHLEAHGSSKKQGRTHKGESHAGWKAWAKEQMRPGLSLESSVLVGCSEPFSGTREPAEVQYTDFLTVTMSLFHL